MDTAKQWLRSALRGRRKYWTIAAIPVVVLVLWIYDHYGHPGRVYDGTTGLPLEGAFVIRRWGAVVSMVVETRSVCYQLKIDKTDATGTYHLPYLSWSFAPGAMFSSSAGRGTVVYKAGYYAAGDRSGITDDQVVLWPEARAAEERLWALTRSIEDGDCAGGLTYQAIRVPLYEAIAREGTALAKTKNEQAIASGLRYRANHIRLGGEAADAIIRKEREDEGGAR